MESLINARVAVEFQMSNIMEVGRTLVEMESSEKK